jgi:hypothetical protein
MPLPQQKVDEALRTSRLNRVFGLGITNYVATSTTLNSLQLDHGLSKEKLLGLREQLVKDYINANLTVDRKKLILENLIGEVKSIKNDNASSDIQKERLKKKSILLTRKISQLKDNVLKVNRINKFIQSFKDGSVVLHEEKFEQIFKDLGVQDDDRRIRKLQRSQVKIQVDLQKDLDELKAINEELIADRDQLLKEIMKIRESYGKNVHVFDEIFKLSNGGKENEDIETEDIMDVDKENEEIEEELEQEDREEVDDRDEEESEIEDRDDQNN